MTENGVTRELTVREIQLRAQSRNAMIGNAQAQRDMYRQARELDEYDAKLAQEAKARRADLYKDHQEWHAAMVTIYQSAAQHGLEPKIVWPHPDDFVFDDGAQRCRIRGPISERDVPLFEWMRAERDALFVRSALWLKRPSKARCMQINIFDCLWICYDVMLPLRWQTCGNAATLLAVIRKISRRELEESTKHYAAKADTLRAQLNLPSPGKAEYKVANTIMKTVAQRLGYRSLAHLEAELGESGIAVEAYCGS
ncbi:hypothetical protein EYB45_08860 [Erythrobacteraceae bacterium CFH 75059]|nr:hypothetical protein EYB45_08860 [Erythrobacteraceae bacterium CFH 75059]